MCEIWRITDLRNMYSYMGIVISGTGILHCLIGYLNRNKLGQYLGWFETSGFALILIGILVDWIIRVQGLKVPLIFCISFLLLSIFATVSYPKSGVWLVMIESVFLIIGKFIY